MKQGYFVTGTDTAVGKTAASCALIRSFSKLGRKAAGMKPVSSGGEDALRLASAGDVVLPKEVANPYDFSEPIAPHIAARHEGKAMEIDLIVRAYDAIEADIVVVEGVGGFLVPLDGHLDTSDLVRLLGIPVILVVGMKLGAINHALLTAEAVESRGLHLAGWIANSIEPEMPAFDEVLEAIRLRIDAPLLDVLPFDPEERFLIDVSGLA